MRRKRERGRRVGRMFFFGRGSGGKTAMNLSIRVHLGKIDVGVNRGVALFRRRPVGGRKREINTSTCGQNAIKERGR